METHSKYLEVMPLNSSWSSLAVLMVSILWTVNMQSSEKAFWGTYVWYIFCWKSMGTWRWKSVSAMCSYGGFCGSIVMVAAPTSPKPSSRSHRVWHAQAIHLHDCHDAIHLRKFMCWLQVHEDTSRMMELPHLWLIHGTTILRWSMSHLADPHATQRHPHSLSLSYLSLVPDIMHHANMQVQGQTFKDGPQGTDKL